MRFYRVFLAVGPLVYAQANGFQAFPALAAQEGIRNFKLNVSARFLASMPRLLRLVDQSFVSDIGEVILDVFCDKFEGRLIQQSLVLFE